MIPVPHSYDESVERQIRSQEAPSQSHNYYHHHDLPNSAHSDRSEWLDEPVSRPQSTQMRQSVSQVSNSSSFASPHSSNHHQHQMQPEGHHHHHHQRYPSSYQQMPSVIFQSSSNREREESPAGDSEGGVQAPWDERLAASPTQTQTFNYVESNSSSRGEQPQLTSVRVGKACGPCRSRKVKCEGGFPHCRLCLEKGRTEECVYRVIPPRSITRKAVDGLQARLDMVETQLKASQDEAKRSRSLLFQARKELEEYRSGERTRELERRLQELQLRLKAHQRPSEQDQQQARRSSDHSTPFFYEKPRGSVVQSYQSPPLQSSSEVDSSEAFYPSKRHQHHQSMDRSSSSLSSVQTRPQNHGPPPPGSSDVRVATNNTRRRAATTTVSSKPTLFNDGQVGNGLNISFGLNEGDKYGSSYQRREHQHQHGSDPGHHLVCSHSVSRGSTHSPFYPPTSESLPLPSPPILDLQSGSVTSRSVDSTSPATAPDDSQMMEPCYLSAPFIDPNRSSPSFNFDQSNSHSFNHLQPQPNQLYNYVEAQSQYSGKYPKQQHQNQELQQQQQQFHPRIPSHQHDHQSSHVADPHSSPPQPFMFNPHQVPSSFE